MKPFTNKNDGSSFELILNVKSKLAVKTSIETDLAILFLTLYDNSQVGGNSSQSYLNYTHVSKRGHKIKTNTKQTSLPDIQYLCNDTHIIINLTMVWGHIIIFVTLL